jgi:hypothetical protein
MAAPRSAGKRLELAEAAIQEGNRRLAALVQRRNECLLRDRDSEAAALALEIQEAQRLVQGHNDKVALLRAEAEREANEKRVREDAARIERIEKTARGERSAAAAEFTDGITKVDKAMRRLISVGKDLQAAHNWLPHDILACLLAPSTIVVALQHEMFRLGGKARLYGGMDLPHADLTNFPGSKSPTLQLLGTPELVKPLASVLAEANELLSRILRTGKGSAAVEANAAPAVAAVTGGDALVANGQGESPPRSESDRKLGALLRKLDELGGDPMRKAEYDDVVAAIARVEDERAAEKRVEQQYA